LAGRGGSITNPAGKDDRAVGAPGLLSHSAIPKAVKKPSNEPVLSVEGT